MIISKKLIQQCKESEYPTRDKNGDLWQIQAICDTCGGPQKGKTGDFCIDYRNCKGHITECLVSFYWWNKDRENKFIPI